MIASNNFAWNLPLLSRYDSERLNIEELGALEIDYDTRRELLAIHEWNYDLFASLRRLQSRTARRSAR